jgi:hypothetical protein
MNLIYTIASLTALTISSAAPIPDESCMLIDRSSRVVRARLMGISDSQVRVERGGILDQRDVSDLLMLVLDDESDENDGIIESASMGLIELTDGQRWVGNFVPEERRDDRIAWDTANMGRLTVAVEKIRRMNLRGRQNSVIRNALESNDVPEAVGDRLVLTNGDVLHGFLDSAGKQFVFETNDGQRVELSYVQVAQVELLNPAQARRGALVWMADGSITGVEDLTWTPAVMRLTIAGRQTGAISGGSLRGVVFASEMFVALSELEPQVSRLSDWMDWVEPPRRANPNAACGLSDIQLRGPVEVTYTIPSGSTQLRTTAVVPRRAGPWADLVLDVLVDGRSVWREPMDATGRSRREIELDLSGGRALTIRIEEGGRGPVDDVVILERPMILLDGP